MEEQRATLLKLLSKVHIAPSDQDSLGHRDSTCDVDAITWNDEEAAGNVVKHVERLQGQWKVAHMRCTRLRLILKLKQYR